MALHHWSLHSCPKSWRAQSRINSYLGTFSVLQPLVWLMWWAEHTGWTITSKWWYSVGESQYSSILIFRWSLRQEDTPVVPVGTEKVMASSYQLPRSWLWSLSDQSRALMPNKRKDFLEGTGKKGIGEGPHCKYGLSLSTHLNLITDPALSCPESLHIYLSCTHDYFWMLPCLLLHICLLMHTDLRWMPLGHIHTSLHLFHAGAPALPLGATHPK